MTRRKARSIKRIESAVDIADLRQTGDICGHIRAANLSGLDLSYTDLRGAKLTCANLDGANLSGALLFGADLTGVRLADAWAWSDSLPSGFPSNRKLLMCDRYLDPSFIILRPRRIPDLAFCEHAARG
ncbi:MAG: pentapeptide repeat-containing protein [Spirochaetaceae bacterium]|nr:pentapeptide repeat-containing protein [Spirochaetaceae bacterium]